MRMPRHMTKAGVVAGSTVAVVVVALGAWAVSGSPSSSSSGRPPATSDTGGSSPSTTTTAGTTTSSTGPRATSTTTGPTSAATTSTTTATAAGGTLGDCTNDQFTLTNATDGSSYNAGQAVELTVTLHNDGATCAFRPYCTEPSAEAYNSSGQVVWSSRPLNIAVSCPAPSQTPPLFGAGQTKTTKFSWSQTQCTTSSGEAGCPDSQVPPGTYTLRGTWDPQSDGNGPSGRAAAAVITIS